MVGAISKMTAVPWTKKYTLGDALSALEHAVVDAAFLQIPALKNAENDNLKVACRDYTVHGLYTYFRADFTDGYPEGFVLEPLDILIESDQIENGACAIAYYIGNCLLGLEMASHGGSFALPISSFQLSSIWN